MTGRDVLAAIERRCSDPEIRSIAAAHYAITAPAALANDHSRKPGTIRASDAGRCVREVWADVHDKFDLPQDAITQLSRFDLGTLYGAWLAALLKATLETEEPNRYRVRCEVVVERHGIPGHADAFIDEQLAPDEWVPVFCTEFKSTYTIKNNDAPSEKRPYQAVQVSHYSLDKRNATKDCGIITMAPAAWPAENRFTFEDIDPDVWALRPEVEYGRLGAALLDEMPEGDPDAPWRCTGCRFSACELNKNPAVNMVEI